MTLLRLVLCGLTLLADIAWADSPRSSCLRRTVAVADSAQIQQYLADENFLIKHGYLSLVFHESAQVPRQFYPRADEIVQAFEVGKQGPYEEAGVAGLQYRGMRIPFEELESILHSGLQTSKTYYGYHHMTHEPSRALRYSLRPGGCWENRYPPDRPLLSVLIQIQLPYIPKQDEVEGDIPPDQIADVFILDTAEGISDPNRLVRLLR